jgi:hypothetical protein
MTNTIYDDLMGSTSDVLTERAARAFHLTLQESYPGVVWVRLRRDDERLRRPVAPPLARDVDDRVVGPDDVQTLGKTLAA